MTPEPDQRAPRRRNRRRPSPPPWPVLAIVFATALTVIGYLRADGYLIASASNIVVLSGYFLAQDQRNRKR